MIFMILTFKELEMMKKAGLWYLVSVLFLFVCFNLLLMIKLSLQGLTPKIFWENKSFLLEGSYLQIESRVDEILSKLKEPKVFDLRQQTTLMKHPNEKLITIGNTGFVIGSCSNDFNLQIVQEFSLVINSSIEKEICGIPETVQYFQIPIRVSHSQNFWC